MSPRQQIDAKEWVKNAVAFYKSSGKRIALAAFTDPYGMFVQAELYIYVLNPKGTMLAHGINEKFVGEEFIELMDSTGRNLSGRSSKPQMPMAAAGWTTNGIIR